MIDVKISRYITFIGLGPAEATSLKILARTLAYSRYDQDIPNVQAP